MTDRLSAASQLSTQAGSDMGAVPRLAKTCPLELEIRSLTPDDPHWDAYGRFRAEWYIDKLRYLRPEARNDRGEEFDQDETRSTHLVAFAGDCIVGTARLIHSGLERPLPVERVFGLKASRPSCEASRLIVDAARFYARTRQLARLSLYRAMVFHAQDHGERYVYAMLEPFLVESLKEDGIDTQVVAPRQLVPAYRTENMGVRMDMNTIMDGLRRKDAEKGRSVKAAPFFALGSAALGLGKVTWAQLKGGDDHGRYHAA